MPIIKESSYKRRSWYLFNAWLEMLIPYFSKKRYNVTYRRERLELEDGDFLDLDWVKNDSNQLIIVSHGFEGNSRDHFILELASHIKDEDLLVWHYRSCSGEPNRKPRFYHHGDIEDLDAVVSHACDTKHYDEIFLIGFSMGGNLVINYLGGIIKPNKRIKKGVVISTPMDLSAASSRLCQKLNGLVEKSFVEKWKKKIALKANTFPEHFNLDKLKNISTLEDLMEEYVLPHQGFADVKDYYAKWSSLQFIPRVNVPLLIVNAKNDPLLSENCYPFKESDESPHVFLETPRYGSHTGFSRKRNGIPWYVTRIKEFFSEEIK